MKKCSKCGYEKSLDEFGKDKKGKFGRRSVCFLCRKKLYWVNVQESRKQKRITYHKYKDKEKRQNYYKENKIEINVERRKNYLKNPLKFLIRNAKNRAIKKGISFDLKEEDLNIPEVCPVFKKPFVFGTGKQELFSPSVDRIDNSKGYIKSNIVIVSVKANFLKNNATIEELEALTNFYKQFKKES